MTRSTNDKAQFVCKRFANEVGDVQLKSLNFMDANRDQPQAKAKGQKFQKVENDENRFFAITSSKLFKN